MTSPPIWVRLILFLLWILSLVYSFCIWLWAKSKSKNPINLDMDIYSVGNITVGGTGKTPLVIWLANYLGRNKKNVAVVLRGFKREDGIQKVLVVKPEQSNIDLSVMGDEALLIRESCPGVTICVSADRVAAIHVLKRERIDTVVLDDGFQQVHFNKKKDLVCLDHKAPLSNGYLLPRGLLREHPRVLSRASGFVFCKGVEQNTLNQFKKILSKYSVERPCFIGSFQIKQITRIGFDESVLMESFFDKKIAILAAIGSPESFKGTVKEAGIETDHEIIFPDHYPFNQKDVESWEKECRKKSITSILTTQKDVMRLRPLKLSLDYFSIEMELVVEDSFLNFLNS